MKTWKFNWNNYLMRMVRADELPRICSFCSSKKVSQYAERDDGRWFGRCHRCRTNTPGVDRDPDGYPIVWLVKRDALCMIDAKSVHNS